MQIEQKQTAKKTKGNRTKTTQRQNIYIYIYIYVKQDERYYNHLKFSSMST